MCVCVCVCVWERERERERVYACLCMRYSEVLIWVKKYHYFFPMCFFVVVVVVFLSVWNTLLFPLPGNAFKFNFFQEAFLDPTYNPFFFALCVPLLVCLPYHAECYLFICLSLLTLKVLQGKVTALLISLSPVPISIGIAWTLFDLKWIKQMVNEYLQFYPMKAKWG